MMIKAIMDRLFLPDFGVKYIIRQMIVDLQYTAFIVRFILISR